MSWDEKEMRDDINTESNPSTHESRTPTIPEVHVYRDFRKWSPRKKLSHVFLEPLAHTGSPGSIR